MGEQVSVRMTRVVAPGKAILIVGDERDVPGDLEQALCGLGRVIRADTYEDAADQLGGDSVEWVILPAATFGNSTPVQRVQALRILEVIDHGACLLAPDGSVLWANNKFRELPEEVRQRVCSTCQQTFKHLADPPHVRPRRLSISTSQEQYFEVTATPICESGGGLRQVAAIINDVTHARRLLKKIDAIDQAGRELVRLDAEQFGKLDFGQRIDLLRDKVMRYVKDLLHYDNFAVRLLDRRTNKLELIFASGLPAEAQQLDLYALPEGNGISGYVAATGRSYMCPDCSQDARYVFGIENPGSTLTVPLRLHDKVIGVFNVESEKIGAFTEDDRQFAEIFGRYLAVALNILDLMVVERSETTGRLADNVASEISGPLNDILSDATTLKEDYIGHDDLRHRLQSIIDNVSGIRTAIQHVGRPSQGLLGVRQAETTADPLLAGKRILVADDEQTIRETIADVLGKLGCAVDTARDGAEAVAMLENRPYDLVLSDIRMPHKNGYEVFAQAKDANSDCAVILMTGFGYDPHHSIIRARQEGLSAVLFKPFKIDQLLTEVRNALKVEA